MLDPDELYVLEPDLPPMERPVLVHALTGFIDAGSGTFLAALGHGLPQLCLPQADPRSAVIASDPAERPDRADHPWTAPNWPRLTGNDHGTVIISRELVGAGGS